MRSKSDGRKKAAMANKKAAFLFKSTRVLKYLMVFEQGSAMSELRPLVVLSAAWGLLNAWTVCAALSRWRSSEPVQGLYVEGKWLYENFEQC
ncbi:hypothetical protein INT43_004116 [Umbelopsis isabellina]|uniref:Uncharacterized protein n=1 Tax=Mortierella isabellina TaxID=91625 RepID=A0A8H7U7Y7_MORIS|nr:hypothetical protein INT43_004116 [Umbelopsis isabellina]